jgi:hypothetical protein
MPFSADKPASVNDTAITDDQASHLSGRTGLRHCRIQPQRLGVFVALLMTSALSTQWVGATTPRRQAPPPWALIPDTPDIVALRLLQGDAVAPGLCDCTVESVHPAPLRHVVFSGSIVTTVDPNTKRELGVSAGRLSNGQAATLNPKTRTYPTSIVELNRQPTQGLVLKVNEWFKGQPINQHFYGISHFPTCGGQWTPAIGERRLFLIAGDGDIRPFSACDGLDAAAGIDERTVLDSLRRIYATLPLEALTTDYNLKRSPTDSATP